jgi:hypothetical protein
MKQKLLKARLHPRDKRSPRHAAWKKNISAAMTAAKRKRVEVAHLLTLTQVAAITCLPLYSIRKMVECGQLKCIHAGNRCYVPESEIARLKAA